MDFIVEKALENMPAQEEFENMSQASIKVIGVGGAGNNVVGWLYKKGIKGAEIIATNTDHQHLNITGADRKYLIGKDCTRGLGCGGFPSRGAEAAQESLIKIKESLKDSEKQKKIVNKQTKLKKLKRGKMSLEWFADKSSSSLYTTSKPIKGFKKVQFKDLQSIISS